MKNINNYEQDLQLLGKMKHRGPDAQEIVIKDNTLLGFNRLAIREIVEGNQPYLSKEGRFISCINGELYNDVQVRKRLQIDFPTMSLPKGDMQLLAELISIKGIEGLKLADGMFAGFIYHYEVSKLVLFRDKVGEKPIFYCEMGDDFYVASEIRSLPVKHLSQSDNFQRGLVRGFWAGGETFYSNIMKVSPGTLIEMDLKSKARKVSKFWSWDNTVVSNKKSQFVRGGSKEELSRIFSDGIRQSVASQLASEVPVAAFLSGGLDSAAVVKASAECLGKPLPTFTLRFEGIPNKEHKIAEATARFLKSEHQIIRVNDAELPELIKQSISAMDWPILDPACIGIFALSHEISKKGFKVALTGDGGDELFRGYKVFSYLRLMAIAMKIPNVSKFVLENALKFNIKEKNYLGFHMLGSRMRQVMISSYFSVPEIAISPFSGSEILEELLPKSTEKMRETSSLQEMMSNFENYYRSFVLPELYLQKSDKMSMAHSIEIRNPLLGSQCLQAQRNILEQVKGSINKRQILSEYLGHKFPSEVKAAPKRGFAVPIRSAVLQMQEPDWIVKKFGISGDVASRTWKRLVLGDQAQSHAVWSLLVLNAFAEKIDGLENYW